jgi:hypothetical protein
LFCQDLQLNSREGNEMSRLLHVGLLGLSMVIIGCGAQVSEMGPATEAPKMSAEDQMKHMQESSKMNKREGGPELAPTGPVGDTPATKKP